MPSRAFLTIALKAASTISPLWAETSKSKPFTVSVRELFRLSGFDRLWPRVAMEYCELLNDSCYGIPLPVACQEF
jgi:hypothetical protein